MYLKLFRCTYLDVSLVVASQGHEKSLLAYQITSGIEKDTTTSMLVVGAALTKNTTDKTQDVTLVRCQRVSHGSDLGTVVLAGVQGHSSVNR